MEFKDAVNRDIVASRVKYARGCAKLTQAEVAKELGVTPQQVSNYERGLTGIPNNVLGKMADLYGTSVSFFLGDSSKGVKNINDGMADLFSTLLGSIKNLNSEEIDAALELQAILSGFLRYLAREHPASLTDAARCLEAACDCFTHICDYSAKFREMNLSEAELIKLYLADIDRLKDLYAYIALCQAADSAKKE